MNKSFHDHFQQPEALTPENQDRFVFPARADCALASLVSGASPQDWEGLSIKLFRCFWENIGWENKFTGIHFNYSRFTRRASALTGDTVDWDVFDDENDFHKLHFKFTGMDMKWLPFHKAAYEQRKALEGKISKVRFSA